MTDQLKMAEEIEKWSDLRQTGDLTTMQLRPESWRLLAAALRLAEAYLVELDAYSKLVEMVCKHPTDRPAWQEADRVACEKWKAMKEAEAVYRAAKEAL